MSSRFPTRLLSRSASTSIVSRRARACSSVNETSAESRLDDEALIDASGVRRSWLTAASSAVRSSLPCMRASAAAASACSRRVSRATASWAAKAPSTSRSAPSEVGARDAQLDTLREREGERLRARGRRAHRPRRGPPGRGRLRTTAAWSSRNRATRLASSSGIGSPLRSSDPAMPARASASPRARVASAARRAATSTSVLTTPATSRNAATAARSRSLRIVNVWMRLGEEPVERSPNPATAAKAAGQMPPTVAATTTSMR